MKKSVNIKSGKRESSHFLWRTLNSWWMARDKPFCAPTNCQCIVRKRSVCITVAVPWQVDRIGIKKSFTTTLALAMVLDHSVGSRIECTARNGNKTYPIFLISWSGIIVQLHSTIHARNRTYKTCELQSWYHYFNTDSSVARTLKTDLPLSPLLLPPPWPELQFVYNSPQVIEWFLVASLWRLCCKPCR